MKDILSKKAKLQKQLNDIIEQEEKNMVAIHYPIFKKKYEGKYFKRRNSYSCPEKKSDYWWTYCKVTEIKPSDIYQGHNCILSKFDGYSFEIDKDGNIRITQEKYGYTHMLGQEISEKEFNDAWNKMINKINAI